MIFVIMPTWLHHTFQMRTLDTFYDPGPLWKDYIIFGMLAGSELSLSSIAYALPLPSWISSIHLFVYIFCTYTCLTLLYLYGYKQSIWMYVASPIIAPGSGTSIQDVFFPFDRRLAHIKHRLDTETQLNSSKRILC